VAVQISQSIRTSLSQSIGQLKAEPARRLLALGVRRKDSPPLSASSARAYLTRPHQSAKAAPVRAHEIRKAIAINLIHSQYDTKTHSGRHHAAPHHPLNHCVMPAASVVYSNCPRRGIAFPPEWFSAGAYANEAQPTCPRGKPLRLVVRRTPETKRPPEGGLLQTRSGWVIRLR